MESYITAIRGKWKAEQTWKACRTFDNLASYIWTFWSMSVRSSTLLMLECHALTRGML